MDEALPCLAPPPHRGSRSAWICLAFAVLASLGCATREEQEPALEAQVEVEEERGALAEVVSCDRGARIQLAGSHEWRTLWPGDAIHRGDRLSGAEDSEIRLRYFEGGDFQTFRPGPNSCILAINDMRHFLGSEPRAAEE